MVVWGLKHEPGSSEIPVPCINEKTTKKRSNDSYGRYLHPNQVYLNPLLESATMFVSPQNRK